MALNFDKYEVTFSKGLNQKADARLVQAPELVRAVDVEFDDIGGLRLRYPYASIGSSIFGGGTISDCRRIYAVGSELILFTSTAMYSWSSQRSAWVLKGTHLAAKVEERPVSLNTSDQYECDRAELNGTIVHCWRQVSSGSDRVFVSAQDSATGAVLLAPEIAGTGTHPRIIALATTIVLFYESVTGALVASSINPTTLAIGAATTILASGSFNTYYDVEKDPLADQCRVVTRRDTTTAYSVIVVTSALVVTASTETYTCDGPIAISHASDGSFLVARVSGVDVLAEVFDTTGSVTHDERAVGSGTTLINQVTAAWVDTTTCHVFWHSDEQVDVDDFDIDHNTVTTAGVVGSAAQFIRRLGIASRAFAYNGHAYFWTVFAGTSGFSGASPAEFRAQLQNSYFLYRHDGLLVGKAAWMRGGGQLTNGLLPGVALTSGSTGFSFCACERRIVPLGEYQTGFSDRGPRDVTVTFDSNDARRVAKLGETVYITGAEILQYDGHVLAECGFHLYPWYFDVDEIAAGGCTNGVYTVKVTFRYDNAKGERERSTTATYGQIDVTGGLPRGLSFVTWPPLHVTHKSGVAVEAWRTRVDAGEPFYLSSSSDPSVTANPNRFIPNAPTSDFLITLDDYFTDDELAQKEPNPENDGVLENLAPPSATLIAANADRLFLAGVAGDPHRVCYSKQRNAGEVAAFHDALSVPIPEAGGDITGLAFLGEILIVFRETAIYALEGQGFDNTGGGSNYVARLLISDCGAVNQESIVATPAGLVYKSSKGWYRLAAPQAGANVYIGKGVCDYDSEMVHAAHIVESQHQVRIVTSGRVLIWDYLQGDDGKWAEWSISDGLHACLWDGVHHVLATSAVRAQQTTHATTTYGMDVEMLLHFNGLQGFGRCRGILLLGEYRSTHTLRWRLGKYEEGTYFQDKTVTPSGYSVGDEYEELLGPTQQQHKVIRLRLTSAVPVDAFGEQVRLSALSLDIGIRPGIHRHLGAAQRH